MILLIIVMIIQRRRYLSGVSSDPKLIKAKIHVDAARIIKFLNILASMCLLPFVTCDVLKFIFL